MSLDIVTLNWTKDFLRDRKGGVSYNEREELQNKQIFGMIIIQD